MHRTWIVAAILCGLHAAEGQDQGKLEKPAKPNAGPKMMIKIPISPKTASAAWPRAGVPEYLFSVRSYGGPGMGVEISEYDSTLELDSRTALVSYEQFRSSGDIPGDPIGLFRTKITDSLAVEFLKFLTALKLDAVKPNMSKHPGSTERKYTLIKPPDVSLELRVNNSDDATNSQIRPLVSRVKTMLAASLDHPERAVKLGLAQTTVGLEASITNIGLERICFSDPKWLVAANKLHRAAIVYAEYPEEKPGYPPRIFWNELPLETLSPYPLKEPLVNLAPGAVWKTTVHSWTREPGKRYIAYFTWANYLGEPMPGGVYRIRGKVDSERLVINP